MRKILLGFCAVALMSGCGADKNIPTSDLSYNNFSTASRACVDKREASFNACGEGCTTQSDYEYGGIGSADGVACMHSCFVVLIDGYNGCLSQ